MKKIVLQPMVKAPKRANTDAIVAITIVLALVFGASALIAAERAVEYRSYARAEARV